MRIFLVIFTLFLCFINTSHAQFINISSESFNKLIPKHRGGYIYCGNGRFSVVRSCHIIWIGVTFESIQFERADSVLKVSGELHNDAAYGKPLLTYTSVQLLIGKFIIDTTNEQQATISIRESRNLDNAPYFDETLKILPEESICFALSQKSDSLVTLGWVKLYEAGKLLK